MSVSESMSLAYAWVAGVSLGAMFFGGLWWTVRRAMASQRVALWFLASMLARSGIVLTGFYLVADGDWRRLLAALLGFVCARLVATRLARIAAPPWEQEAGHAP